MARDSRSGGVSLAKGPAGLLGLALLAYGVSGLIFGGNGFASDPIDGTVDGTTWLGLEGNGWTNLLFAGSGALLLLGAPLHWGAKTLALVVGLALGAASVIALADGQDVFGIFAANGLTKLVWGLAAAVLPLVALLPRVGKDKHRDDDVRTTRDSSWDEPGPGDRFEPEGRRTTERVTVGDTPESRVVSPADDGPSGSRAASRRPQR